MLSIKEKKKQKEKTNALNIEIDIHFHIHKRCTYNSLTLIKYFKQKHTKLQKMM